MINWFVDLLLYLLAIYIGGLPIYACVRYFKEKRYYMFGTSLLVSLYIATFVAGLAVIQLLN